MKQSEAEEIILEIARHMIACITIAEEEGIPSRILYLPLSQKGVSPAQFESLMRGLVKTGQLVKKGECYCAPQFVQ